MITESGFGVSKQRPRRVAGALVFLGVMAIGAGMWTGCSLAADLDTETIEQRRCQAADDCRAEETCGSDGFCVNLAFLPEAEEPGCNGCAGGQSCCGEQCVDTFRDPANCGACGATCLSGEDCYDNRCFCEPLPMVQPRECNPLEGETCCPGAGCVDTASDPGACGGCGVTCNPGESCDGGRCVCGAADDDDDDDDEGSCGEGRICCDGECCGGGEICCGGECRAPQAAECQCGDDGPCAATESCCGADGIEQCVDLTSDADHCGACGVSCGPGQICAGGSCRCLENQGDCDGDPSNGCEVALDEPEACGACNKECAPGEYCDGGMCICPNDALACGQGQACCQTGCADLESDSDNCGACGQACTAGSNASGADCEEGRCTQRCEDGWADCNGDPADGCEKQLNSVDNCGQCGNVCPEGNQCVDGMCQCLGECACQSGESWCNGGCVDPGSSVEHCGTCGNECPVGASCNAGSCECPSGTTACDDECIDTGTDAHNCGGCDIDCSDLPNTKGHSCVAGGCQFKCKNGFGDCTSAPGCETALNTTSNCGQCGTTCAPGASCANGVCRCANGNGEVCSTADGSKCQGSRCN